MPPRRKPTRPADSPERWLILCRQSDTDEAGRDSLSLESQERALRDVAASRGAFVIGAVRDADLKGYQDETERPALAEALRRAESHEYDVLAIWELSRLARKLSLQERILERLERAGVRLHSQQEAWTSDPLVRQILGAVAEQQTRTISAHVVRAQRHRRMQGRWIGALPYGYQLGDDGHLVVDPVAAPVVRDIFRLYDRGLSTVEITRHLNRTGVLAPREHQGKGIQPLRGTLGGWGVTTVTHMLDNPVYLGRIVIRDEVVATDAHPALVDTRTFERTRRRRAAMTANQDGERFGRARVAETFLDGGRARCRCGARLHATWTSQTNRNGIDRLYHCLRCSGVRRASRVDRAPRACDARPRTVMLHIAESWAIDRLAADLAAVRPWKTVAAEIDAATRAAMPDRDQRRQALARRRRDIVARRDRAIHLHVTGRIDLDGYDQLVAGIAEDLSAIDDEIAAIAPDAPQAELRLAESLAAAWAPRITAATRDDLRAAMTAVGATLILDGSVEGRFRMVYDPSIAALLPRNLRS